MTSDDQVMYMIGTRPPEVGIVVGAIAVVFGELWKRRRAGRMAARDPRPPEGGSDGVDVTHSGWFQLMGTGFFMFPAA